ncbi:MAG: hypothetical protein ABIG84_00725 [archaeon]
MSFELPSKADVKEATTIRNVLLNNETYENRTFILRNVTAIWPTSNWYANREYTGYARCDFPSCTDTLTDSTGSICFDIPESKSVPSSCFQIYSDKYPNATCYKIVDPEENINIMRDEVFDAKATLKKAYDTICNRTYWYVFVEEKVQ